MTTKGYVRELGEVFDNGCDDAKQLLLWCAQTLYLNVKVDKAVGDYVSNDVCLNEVMHPTDYPNWVNSEATGLQIIRYAELCVQYLHTFDQEIFYDSDGANPELFNMTTIERIHKRDVSVAIALKDADTGDVRKMAKVIKECAITIHQTFGEVMDVRDELVVIEFLLSAVKFSIISYEMRKEQYRIRYQQG